MFPLKYIKSKGNFQQDEYFCTHVKCVMKIDEAMFNRYVFWINEPGSEKIITYNQFKTDNKVLNTFSVKSCPCCLKILAFNLKNRWQLATYFNCMLRYYIQFICNYFQHFIRLTCPNLNWKYYHIVCFILICWDQVLNYYLLTCTGKLADIQLITWFTFFKCFYIFNLSC